MSDVSNGKSVIDFRSSQFMHSLNGRYECFYSDEIVKQKNALHCICNHSMGLIIRYITSRTQYLT